MFVKVIGAFFMVICLAVSMEIPKKFLLYSGFVGGFGWGVYLFSEQHLGAAVAATFISAMAITILSQIGARILKAPVTVFLIAGILPLVPGTGMYRTVYYTIHNQGVLANYYLRQTLMIAGAIALAIFIIDSVYRVITGQGRHLKEVLIVTVNKNEKK